MGTAFARQGQLFGIVLAFALMSAGGRALAQDQVSSGGENDQAAKAGSDRPAPSPFALTKPGQTDTASSATPDGVTIDLLHWYPIDSHCAFVDPSGSVQDGASRDAKSGSSDGDVNAAGDGDGDEPAYVFLTMVQHRGAAKPGSGDSDGASAPLERGYVMANGLVRELEKGKTAANRNGNVVTVFRSAGEPRINVNVVITGTKPGTSGTGTLYKGTMTVFWGDKQKEVPIEGSCRA